MLVLTRKHGERISLLDQRTGDIVWVVVSNATGPVKLGFDAPADYRIDREEVYHARKAAARMTARIG